MFRFPGSCAGENSKQSRCVFMELVFSHRMQALQPSAIREIFKNMADPSIIPFAGGNPSHEAFPVKELENIARIVFENGDHDGLVLRCYYPGKITGDQVCRIRLNGKQMPDLVFTDNNMEYEIPAAPHQTISLEFSCNFYVKDAKERRGEDRLSMIVSMEEK